MPDFQTPDAWINNKEALEVGSEPQKGKNLGSQVPQRGLEEVHTVSRHIHLAYLLGEECCSLGIRPKGSFPHNHSSFSTSRYLLPVSVAGKNLPIKTVQI